MSQTTFLSDVTSGEQIPAGKLAYFQARLSNLLHEAVLTQFTKLEKDKGFTRADLARRIGRKPEQVTRWFGSPGNWTLETVSDLLLAMGCELEPKLRDLVTEDNSQVVTHNAGSLRSDIPEAFRQGVFQLSDTAITLFAEENGTVYAIAIPLTPGMQITVTAIAAQPPGFAWLDPVDINGQSQRQYLIEQQSLSHGNRANTLATQMSTTARFPRNQLLGQN